MTELEIKSIVEKQRSFFYSNTTLDINYRLAALRKLKTTIIKYENDICDALHADLGKSSHESYMCEIGMVLDELSYMMKHTRLFSKNKLVKTPLAQFHSKSFQIPSPYGVVLVVSPWNYPFLLTMDPLIDALSAGNTIIIKPSAYSPNTSNIIKKIIEECFPLEYVSVILGGREENNHLLNQKFDYIFFTGSKNVGIQVMEKAATHVTPVTLELGGKSPCIVEKTANIELAAKRIVFGKYLNCGQTCVAPDYIYCDSSIRDQLIKELKKQIVIQFGSAPLTNNNYGKIVNKKHFDRLCGLIDMDKVVHGGKSDINILKIEPTIMDHITWEDAVMKEEIFGPVLPIVTYDSVDEAITKVNSVEHPLALYLFTSDKAITRRITSQCQFGGGCINDVIIHLATNQMGFGGFGESGMGSYHGKTGFDTFSHYKSIVDKKTWIDLPMRYHPYTEFNKKVLKFFLK